MKKIVFSDSELWNHLKNGDRNALETIYYDHVEAMMNYGSRFCGDKALIEDTIHDLFVSIWQSRERLSPTTSIKNYLLGALRNNLLRSIKAESRNSSNEDLNEIKFQVDLNVEEVIMHNEQSRENVLSIQNQMLKLGDRQREAIYLRYFEDHTYDEICSIMGINYQSVRNLISSALKKIKENL